MPSLLEFFHRAVMPATERIELANLLIGCKICAADLQENITVITEGGHLTDRDVPEVLRYLREKHGAHA